MLASVAESSVTSSGLYQGKSYSTTFMRRLDVVSALGGSGKMLTCTVRWKNNSIWHQVEIRTLVASTS